MFPTNRKNKKNGQKYDLSQKGIDQMKQDQNFMKEYREGVEIILESWSCNIEGDFQKDINSVIIENLKPGQYWDNNTIRFGKVLYSLSLFNKNDFAVDDLLQKVRDFGRYLILAQKLDSKNQKNKWIIDLICNS